MTGRTHDKDRLAPVETVDVGPSLSLAQDMLTSDTAQEERFLARLERMKVRPAGRHRRRRIAAIVVACFVVGTGAAAAIGMVGDRDRSHGSTASPPPDAPVLAPPESSDEMEPQIESSELPLVEESEPAVDPIVPPHVTTPAPDDTPDQEPAPPEDASADEPDTPSLSEDIRLLAQIELQRGSGAPPETRLELLGDFVDRFPDSAHVGEVRALTVEALADAGQNEDALLAAERYLILHPDDSRRQQVRWIEATVARDRLQDCERALPAYQELAGDAGPWQEAAQRYVEVCTP